MTDTVTVYRWDDVDAPQLPSFPKTIDYLAILKACLVDGYGTKSGAGWTVVEDGINSEQPSLAVRNAGSGGVTRFYNSAVNQPHVYIRSYQEYVDSTQNAKGGEYSYRITAYYCNKWVLIATAKAFWFLAIAGSVNYVNSNNERHFAFFAGDVYSVYPNDPCTYTQICGDNDASDISTSGSFSTLPYTLVDNNKTATRLFAIDNSNASHAYGLYSAFGVGYCNYGEVNDAPPTIDVMMDFWLRRISGGFNDVQFPILRARVPGLFVSDKSGWRNDAFPVIKIIGGSEYLQMFGGTDKTSAVWIKLDEWQ